MSLKEHIVSEFRMRDSIFESFGVSDIKEAELKKLNSASERRRNIKASGLVYNDERFRVYKIETFDDAIQKSKGTKWCIGQSEEKFRHYVSIYNIYVVMDLNQSADSPFRKVCYLNAGVEDMFVSSDNIHYFETDNVYHELKSNYGKDLLDILG